MATYKRGHKTSWNLHVKTEPWKIEAIRILSERDRVPIMDMAMTAIEQVYGAQMEDVKHTAVEMANIKSVGPRVYNEIIAKKKERQL